MNVLCKGSVDSCMLVYDGLAIFLCLLAIVSFLLITRLRSGRRNQQQAADKDVNVLGYVVSGFFLSMSGFLWFFH